MKKIHNIFIKMFLLLALAIGWGGSAWADAVSVTPTYTPAAGSTVESLTTITVDFAEYVYNVYDAIAFSQGIIPEGTPQQLPELRRISDNAVVATATGVTSNSLAGKPYNITFAAPIPDGVYTLVIPEGTFYKPSSDWQVWSPVSEMTVDYTVSSGVSWPAGIQWEFVKLPETGGYLGYGAGYSDANGLLVNNTTRPTGDAGLWAFVDTGDGFVQVYNKAAGPDLVLSAATGGDPEKLQMLPKDWTVTPGQTTATNGVVKENKWQRLATSKTVNGDSGEGFFLYRHNNNVWHRCVVITDNYLTTAYSEGWSSSTTNMENNLTSKFVFSSTYNLSDSELTLSPATGTRVQESLSSVTITINPASGETVKSADEEGTGYTDDNTPYLISAAAPSNQRGNKAPAGATLASGVSKTGEGVYSITFDPAITTLGDYTLVIPQGAFYVDDVPVGEMSANYTLAGAVVDWTITLTDGAGTNHVFTIPSDAADLSQAAVLTQLDMPGVTLTGYTSDPASHTATATVEFPFKASSATVKNYVTIDAFTANHQFWYTKSATDTEICADLSKGGEDGAKWAIIPHISDSGQFTFDIYNALTGKYINTDGKASTNNASLSSTPSGFVLASANEFQNPTNNLYLSVSSSSGSGQKLLAYSGAHNGTKLTFTGTTAPAILGNDVNLRFVDEGGNDIANGSVTFISGDGSRVTLSGTSYDFQDIVYSKSHFCASFDYKPNDVVYDQVSNTLTFTVAFNKWYTVKSNAGNRYLSSDYADAQGLKMQNGNNPAPTTYGGLWRMVETGTAARNSGGVNINMFNAKYFDTQVLGMGGDNWNQSSGNAARAFMFATDAVPDNYCQNFEQRLNGSNQTFRVDWTKANNSYFNVYSGYLSLWNSGSGYGDANGVFTIEEVPILGEDVVVAVNASNGEIIKYNTQCESAAFLTAFAGQVLNVEMQDGTHFNFHNMPFLPSLFSFEPADDSKILTVTFDKDNQTLTLTVIDDPNLLQFSDAPVDGAWAANTKWFTWRNNRSGTEGQSNPPRRYISTSADFVDANYYFTNTNAADGGNDRGGVWCFVGNESGFQIMNAAYGPDFVFAYLGSNNYSMVLKDAVPSGATTTFTYGEASAAGNTSQLDGANYGYVFRIGTTGNNQIHSNNSGIISWNGGGDGSLRYDDGGSVFKVTAVSDAALEALIAYDVYLVETVGHTGYTSIDYTPTANTFGKRTTAMPGDFLILQADSPIDTANFTPDPDDIYSVVTTATAADATHYYKHLTLNIRDALATEEHTVIFTNGTGDFDYDLSVAEARFLGATCVSNHFYVRPGTTPTGCDFFVDGVDDKFIWGPIFDTTHKTVTFDIRNRAETFQTGLYQLYLKNYSDIEKANYYMKMFDDNINTPSNYVYLAPSVYKNQGAVMKFTGIPTYADEPSTYIYIKDNGNGTVDISSAGQAEIKNISYSFANGEITFNNYRWKDYDNESKDGGEYSVPLYEPMEQPALFQKNATSTTFVLHPTSMVDYDAYILEFVGGTASTTVRYSKPTPSGAHVFGNHDMFVVEKGYTAFLASDFAPSDARCIGYEIVAAPTATDLGLIRLTLDLPVRDFTVYITGDAATSADRVVYKGEVYASGATVSIAGAPVDHTTIKTNVTDRFVWGPIVDEDLRTVTFDIRPLATTLDEGFYQLQLLDLDDSKIANVNTRINNRKGNGNINTASSYIYLMPYQTEKGARILKYNGVPSYAEEPASYIHISKNVDNIQLQSVTGHYTKNNRADYYSDTPTNQAYNFSSGTIWFPGWVIESLWTSTANDYDQKEGPSIAFSGSGNNEQYYITKVDPTTQYDIYQVNLSGTGQTKVRYTGTNNHGNTVVYNNGYLFLTKGDAAPTKELFRFDGSTMVLESIDIDGNNVVTFNFSSPADGLTKTIIHRQHEVYNLVETVDAAYVPSKAHIQPGGGMIAQPHLSSTTPGVTANDLRIQNTSTYVVTQYVKQGESTRCALPFTLGNNLYDFVRYYQRVYNYLTERPLDDDVISSTNTLHDYSLATNGHYAIQKPKEHSNDPEPAESPRLIHNFTLPNDVDELYIAIDCSSFNDLRILGDATDIRNLGTSNLLEPSLSARVIFHLINAEKKADALLDGKIERADYYVPNVKRGSDEHHNNADLIPLEMPFTNYWFYCNGTKNAADLMPVVLESGDLSTVEANLDIVLEGTAADGQPMSNYLEVGLFKDNPGNIGSSSIVSVNHFLYYKYKGSELKRVIPENSVATIKVYARNGADAPYKVQIAEYTLRFVADAEPLAITSVVNNPASTRSEDYFLKNHYSQIASLTFENKELPFSRVPNINKGGSQELTYAFPIDFSRTNYAYNSSYEFGTYSISRRGYGIQFMPVALYEKNIKNPSSMQLGMTDDYFFYIDAAEQPGQVASIPFDDELCAGSRLYCYGWMSSDNVMTKAGGSVVLKLIGKKAGDPDKVLASYLTGTLSDVAYNEDGTPMRSLSYGRTPSMQIAQWKVDDATLLGAWQQIGFSFTLDKAYDEYELQIINNAFSTSGGDYVLDDFRVYVAPAKPTVEFNAPVCFDHVPHMKVTLPREAIENNHVDAEGFAPVSYCFVDKEKYYEKLAALAGDAAPTDAQYNEAFNCALLGNGTATDGSEVDGKPESIRSFWNMKAAYTDAAYDSYKDYNFGKIISGDSDYPIDGVYRQISGASHNIVFSMPIRNSDGWEDNREYIIFFRHGHVTSGFNTAGTGYYNIHVLNCQSSDVFKMSPSLRVNSDLAELATDPPSACAGQVATISADMFGYGPINKVELPHMMYDWWIGYGKVNETDPVEAANVHNFAQLQYGGVYLLNALDNFRAFYPKANEVESSEPQSGEVDGLGHVDYTQADKDCILHFLEPNENGRVPLVLGSRIINIHMLERDAVEENGKKYIYCTIVPITPYVAYDGNDDVIFCPDPQQFKILIDQKAPYMFDGFTALHDDYPASMDNVPVRMGLHQLDAVRLDAKGNMGTHHLRVPLRGVELANTGKPCPIIKNRHKKHTAEESYNDYLTLVYTDDPLYADRMIVGVDELGNMDLLKVGRLQAYNARVGKTNASHTEIGFARDFHPREGYVYTLKVWFEENTDGIADTFVPCPGNLVFDLKVVPEYVQWTAAQGNTDWTNDRNWARADRDVLHADNATSTLVDKSNAAHPYAAYSDNATNYSGDARYKSGDDASAHVFTPMYFTNVLMHDADLRAPEMYTHTAPEAGTSFLGGLKAATATKFIEYDMLATPISQQGSFQGGDDGMTPLALTDRYGVYDKNFGCELFWSNVCNGLTFEPGTMMYDAQHLQYNRVWVEYELSTNRWYTLASPLKNTYAGEWYSPEAGGRQLTPHFYPVTYNPALNDRFNPAYYQRSWDKAGEAWIYRMAGDDDTYVGFDQQKLNSGSVRVQKPVYLNWSYVYNDVAVDYSNGGFSVNAHYTDTDSDGHLLNATDGKVLVRMPKDDLSYDYYQSEAAAHYDKTHPAGGNEQNPDPTQPGTAPGRDDYGNGDTDAGNNPDGSNADGSGNASGRNNANGNNNEYKPKQGNQSHNGDNTELENRKLDSEGHYPHPRLMSDDLKTGGTIAQSIQNASATNPYYLVGNPFMAPMNMDSFFAQQTCTRNGHAESTFSGEKYWMLGTTQQDVYQKVAGVWISNSNHKDAGVVAPLQGFFVQMPVDGNGQVVLPDADPSNNNRNGSISLSFNESMQQPMTVIDEDPNGKPIFGYITGEDGQGQKTYGKKPSLKSRRRSAELEQPTMFRITATNGSQLESTAVVYFHDKASAHYDAREDAETLLDGNIASKVSTVFTSAPTLSGPQDELVSGQDQQALQINTMPAGVTMIPVGVIAPKDDTRTTLRFTGLDALEAAMPETPHLYDADNGTLQVLDEGTTVSVTGTTAGRYFIVSGTTLPVIDDNDDDNDDYDGRIYDLRGIRVNSVQHGTVTISRSRKEYNK